MLKKFVQIFGGDPNKREIDRYTGLVEQVNALESVFEALTDEQLILKTTEYRRRLASGETLEDIMAEAFATVREASKRAIGLRHFDVQLIGGAALHSGKIAEMRTGEGKTLVATLPIYLNAMTLNPDWKKLAVEHWGEDPTAWIFEPIDGVHVGRGVHLITVNDYLARRDARWMAPIYHLLGMSVGVLQMAARTENGKKAFIVDLDRESPHEDQDRLQIVPRQLAYAADITYGTNSEFGFDYLRDNMTMSLDERVQRGHYYAIVDEVDNVLIDEARTPLIISGPAQDEAEWYIRMAQIVRTLRPEDYEISEKDRTVNLTEIGEVRVEEALGAQLRDPDRPEDILPEQARMLGYLEQALRAQYLFRRNKDYLVQAGKVVIIDEFTGRLMPGRRWSDGLHQAVEAKEGAKVQSESVTYATITIQNYFRMYEKLAGMTGTAITEAEEFDKIYKLGVLAIPTNLEYLAIRPSSGLEELEGRDPQGYKYQYYARKDDQNKTPVYWRRKDYPDVVYRTEEAKLRSIAQEILQNHVLGRPVLVGTTSVELSERVSNRLRAEPLRRLCQVLLIRSYWLEKNQREEDGRVIAELSFLNKPLDSLEIGELRKLARDLDVSFSPDDESNLDRLLTLLNLPSDHGPRLVADLQGGIPHEVLNARKHTEESQIIAGAGAFGAVTIATNMAGRGVDIKLGGEIAEEVLSAVHRVLHRTGYENSFEMSMEEMREAISKLDPAEFGIYDAEIQYFLQQVEDMGKVRALGGLHVIGSERHEARRIDNQLRGRSARQGDPGSSRFYLSLEDELMRLFGGAQADNLMQRLKIDDAMPLEVGLVGRLVEQSQTRVEGANFDVRKHLLEYDDVLNTQRARIYSQRNRIFIKDNLSDDVAEMLRTEVNRRVPEALNDEGGPWKLLSWLDQIQPPFTANGKIVPSYSLELIAESILQGKDTLTHSKALQAISDTIQASIDAEKEHLLQSIDILLDQTQEKLESQVKERAEAVDVYLEGLTLEDEDAQPRRPVDIVNEISNLVHVPIKLSIDGQRALRTDPQIVADEIIAQVETALVNQSLSRLIGSIERRMEESLELRIEEISSGDWNRIADHIYQAITSIFENRSRRYLGDGAAVDGQILREIKTGLDKISDDIDKNMLLFLLYQIPQGSKAIFDKKTHRRVWQRTNRITYIYHAARFLENQPSDVITADVLAHLERAQNAMYQAWGQIEFNRLTGTILLDVNQKLTENLIQSFGDDRYEEIKNQLCGDLAKEDQYVVIEQLGRQSLTEIYRQLLVSVITELWVDYLTQMEALRVSIGLEAYAQRDPLVQYKNRAFGLFQELLSNMRLAVVSRMFTYRPREIASMQVSQPASETNQAETIPEQSLDTISEDEEDESDEVETVAVASTDSKNISTAGVGQPGVGKRKRRRRR
jgi:preprotein translocase subunit SecA